MKNYFLGIVILAGILCTSCSSISKTASSQRPQSFINTATIADLEVSNARITFTYEPSKSVRRGGDINVINTAISEALKQNGNGDVLIGMQYTTKNKYNFWGSSIVLITVTGYPAKYKNFHNLDDSIWDKTPLTQSSFPIVLQQTQSTFLGN